MLVTLWTKRVYLERELSFGFNNEESQKAEGSRNDDSTIIPVLFLLLQCHVLILFLLFVPSQGKRLFKQWLCAPLCNPAAINDRYTVQQYKVSLFVICLYT